jgi:hypothetical protein
LRISISAPLISGIIARLTGATDIAVANTTAVAGKKIERVANSHMASAGMKSPRWRGSVKVDALATAGTDIGLITVRQTMWQWIFFEKGASIKGTPLWVPLSFGAAKGISAKKYKEEKLFRVERDGEPDLLMGIETKKPLYVAVDQVTLKKKLNLRETITQEAEKILPQEFSQQLGRLI